MVSPGPLDGVRILDFTANMSGPMATMILGDQGADVVKVEPLAGDILRYVGTGVGDVSAYFANLNRSKRSIALDLSRPESAPGLWALLASADVVVHNFRRGAARRLGLDADAVRAVNPTVVHVAITGFGSDGPYRDRPAYDHIIQALSGFAARQATPGGAPELVRHGIIDKITGQTAAQAITAALLQRARTSLGQTIEISMLAVALEILWPDGMMNHTLVDPNTRGHDIAATFRLTETQDGHLAVILVTSARLKRLVNALGLDRTHLPDSGPIRTGGALIRDAMARLSAMSTQAALDFLVSLDIPAAPVLALDELHQHPQIQASAVIDEFEHPVLGKIRQANPASRFAAGASAGSLRPAPRLGEHGHDVLREVGFSDQHVADLQSAGVLGHHTPTNAPTAERS